MILIAGRVHPTCGKLLGRIQCGTFRQPERGGGNGNLTAGTGFGSSLSRTSSRRKAMKETRVWRVEAPGPAVTQHTAMDTDIIISTVFRMQASLQPDCCIVIYNPGLLIS